MRSLIKLAVTCATLLTASTLLADEANPTAEMFFAFDSAQLGSGASGRLAELVELAKDHPDAKIVVDGYTDPSGSETYNIGLSARRAESVQSELISLGIPADRIYRGINGENGLRRTSHALDRRVSVSITNAPLYAIIDRVLVRGTAVLWNQPATAAEIDGPRAIDTVALARR